VPHGVVHATDGVLNLAFGLVCLASGLQIGIACRLADRFLYRALNLFRGAGNPVLIRLDSPSVLD
jgi:hypothetical protein